jgi:hypothetical protein
MTDKLEPLNMHGHAHTWEEELLEVCAERAALRDESERLRAALRRAADAPCTHCSATDMHGERSTAHHWADQALRQT